MAISAVPNIHTSLFGLYCCRRNDSGALHITKWHQQTLRSVIRYTTPKHKRASERGGQNLNPFDGSDRGLRFAVVRVGRQHARHSDCRQHTAQRS
jgi:hypothetical protein